MIYGIQIATASDTTYTGADLACFVVAPMHASDV